MCMPLWEPNEVVIATLCRPLKFSRVVSATTADCVSAKKEWIERKMLTFELGVEPVSL